MCSSRSPYLTAYLLHVFKDLPTLAGVNVGKHWQLSMGLFIVLMVTFAPRGILGLVARLRGKGAAE